MSRRRKAKAGAGIGSGVALLDNGEAVTLAGTGRVSITHPETLRSMCTSEWAAAAQRVVRAVSAVACAGLLSAVIGLGPTVRICAGGLANP